MRNATVLLSALLVLSAVFGAAVGPATAGSNASALTNAHVECSFPYSATDATGTEVTVEKSPQRIVTLAPSAAQTLWELNASDKVVGVSDNAAYLKGASEKTVVTDGRTVKTEVIVGLEPDIVLAPDVVGDEKVEKLRESGLTVYNFEEAKNFSDVYSKVETIGQLADECEAATATVTDMRERVTAIREAVSDEERPGVLYSFFGYTAGNNTFIDSILTSAGTTNVAAEAGIEGFKPISKEVVANNSESIEWLVLNSNPASHPSSDVYNTTTAVKQNQTIVVNEDYLNQPAPRTVLALENITKKIHPAAYEEAQAALEATPTPTPTATATATESSGDATATATMSDDTATPMMTDSGTETAMDDTPEPATTAGSGPGFTAATGVVALLAAVFVFRRR